VPIPRLPDGFEEDLDDDGPGSWEPAGYYVSRWVFRCSLGIGAAALLAFFADLPYSFEWSRQFTIARLIVLAVAFLGTAAGFVGMILTAPTSKKR
jgi:hypothetical protein